MVGRSRIRRQTDDPRTTPVKQHKKTAMNRKEDDWIVYSRWLDHARRTPEGWARSARTLSALPNPSFGSSTSPGCPGAPLVGPAIASLLQKEDGDDNVGSAVPESEASKALSDVRAAANRLSSELGGLAWTLFVDAALEHARERMAPRFWSGMEGTAPTPTAAVALAARFFFSTLLLARAFFPRKFRSASVTKRLRARSDLLGRCAAELFAFAGPHGQRRLEAAVFSYFKRSFAAHHSRCKGGIDAGAGEKDGAEEEEEGGEGSDGMDVVQDSPGTCDSSAPLAELSSLVSRLRFLGLGSAAERACGATLDAEVEAMVRRTCRDEHEERMLDQLLQWSREVAVTWVEGGGFAATGEGEGKGIEMDEKGGANDNDNENDNENIGDDAASASPAKTTTLAQWSARAEHSVHASLCRLRCDEAWDLVADYPDSAPALDDLRRSLARCVRWRWRRRFIFSYSLSFFMFHQRLDACLLYIVIDIVVELTD